MMLHKRLPNNTARLLVLALFVSEAFPRPIFSSALHFCTSGGMDLTLRILQAYVPPCPQ
jgi:hypothetical protein